MPSPPRLTTRQTAMPAKKPNGPKLGELLAKRGRMDRELLFKALAAQRSVGGRLGTCLLELDGVTEEDLLNVLSGQLDVPFASPEDMRSIAPEIIALVPRKLAEKFRAVPVRASRTQLTVAMVSPHDLAALDELAFVSGRRVRPHVCSETRLLEALARYYKVDIPTRFVKLVDRLNRERFLWSRDGETVGGTAELVREELGSPPAAMPTPPEAEGEAPPQPPSPAPPGDRIEDFEARLAEPGDRDSIGKALIEFASGRASVSLLIKLQKQQASGWLGSVPPLSPEAVAACRVPLSEPSLLQTLLQGAPLHRGPLPRLAAHSEIDRVLGGETVRDVLALPLRVRERLVAVWFLTSREGVLPATLVEQAKILAERASVALELLILRHKLKQT